jgi:hypothetical protein
MPLAEDFFSDYIEYVGESESPTVYHRWCALSAVGAILGRNFHIHHGHFDINPNIYTMLIGNPGTRKSTAIKTVKKLLVDSGYDTIAADKTTKEKFLLDISGETEDFAGGKNGKRDNTAILDENLWGGDDTEVSSRPPAECFIMADEWNDFTSLGNLEFYSLLGTFWDYSGIYKNRIKTGKSVSINNPTISILAGNTPTGFSLAFPTEIVGQGFFSRLILVYGESNGKRIAFPRRPDTGATKEMVTRLLGIRHSCQGIAYITDTGDKLLNKIYAEFAGFDDIRFESYHNRRFTHLLKLCLVCAASRRSNKIEEQDIIYANTILTVAEQGMPKALGEFGKAKNSDIANQVVDVLDKTNEPLVQTELYARISGSSNLNMKDFHDMLTSLAVAGKIQCIHGGWLIKRKIKIMVSNDTVNYELLTKEERRL